MSEFNVEVVSHTITLKDGRKVNVVREFPDADPVAYPEGFYMVSEPGVPGIFFVDRLGRRYVAPKGRDYGFYTLVEGT